jgi:hypothetical protein
MRQVSVELGHDILPAVHTCIHYHVPRHTHKGHNHLSFSIRLDLPCDDTSLQSTLVLFIVCSIPSGNPRKFEHGICLVYTRYILTQFVYLVYYLVYEKILYSKKIIFSTCRFSVECINADNVPSIGADFQTLVDIQNMCGCVLLVFSLTCPSSCH